MKLNVLLLILCAYLFLGNALYPCVQSLRYDNGSDPSVDVYDQSPSEETFVLPPSFSWRDVNGVDFTTPIRNQSPFPSCESFALVGAVETMVQYKVGFPFNCDLSEAHLFFFSGGNIVWGSYPENDTEFLKDYGVPDEACWPYPHDLYQYPLNTTSPNWENRTVKITNWSYLPADPSAIKTALVTNGPVPSYFLVYDDFLYYKKGIYQHRWGHVRGAHYMAIVGYNDDPGYWIVKNSWGVNYQDHGWINIKYGECDIGTKNFYLTGVYGKFPLLYVDDDNMGGPWNGTKEYPYRTISEAIDAAYDGFTIYVKNGTYTEHVVIDKKKITLYGEDKNTTIIDGSGVADVVTVSAPDVKILGLTVQNSGTELFNAGIKTLTLQSNVTIENNIIRDNSLGIYLNYAYASTWNRVSNNSIVENVKGIYAHWANNGQIVGNTISLNKEDGIEMEHCLGSLITDNMVRDNGYGIYFHGASDRNTVSGANTIQGNVVGVKISESNRNRITKNNFIDNLQHAFFSNSFLTVWRRNYWDDRVLFFPKVIMGSIGKREFSWVNMDRYPLLRPLNS
jgi:parallel beta-helix repeat protein